MGRASQRKGRAGELELAQLLQGYGYDVQPGQAVSYGATPDLVGLSGVHIECKRNERLNVPEAPRPSVMLTDSGMARPLCSTAATAPAGW